MSVVDILVGMECAGLNLQSHLLIGIAERHSGSGKLVDFLDREHRVVHRVVEDMLVDFHLINNVSRHLQAVAQLVEGREEHFLYLLKVTEIARRQVVHDEHNLLWQALDLVALGTDKLEDVRILLVRHNA